VRVIEAAPSELARRLHGGELACALVSSIELFRRPDLTFAPGIGIVADGPVHSVRLFSRVPIPQITSVALDTSSLTSVALLKIVLAEQFGLAPRYVPESPNLAVMLDRADAGLLIGDAGYREYDASLHVLDLGAAWKELTGLPFVYALWIGTPARLTPGLASALVRARDWGIEHRDEIAAREFGPLNETHERVRHYLRDVMRYHVGPREIEALRLFGKKAREHDLL
jgi:chorismate dehydratase